MWIEPIGLVTIILGIIIARCGPAAAVWIFVPMTLLGSAGALLFTGNGTIQPAHLLLAFVVPTILLRHSERLNAMRRVLAPNEGFWLLALTIYSVLGSWFLPRIFAGATQVNAIGISAYGVLFQEVPLGPTSGNITQAIYMIADAACFLSVVAYCRDAARVFSLARVIVAYSAVNIAFAALDLITYWTQTSFLIDFMRNAQYMIHSDEAIDGLKRISGSFTETSTFAFATIGALAFTLQLWLAGIWPRTTFALSIISFGLLIISTSTTALVAAPILLISMYGMKVFESVRGGATVRVMMFVVLGPLLLLGAALVIAITPAMSGPVGDYINSAVLGKSSTYSGIQRAAWNTAALRNFEETYFLGGGLGSIRASSFALAVLSNLGAVGVALIVPFYGIVFFRRADKDATDICLAIRSAARTACFGLLLGACISGSMVDLGLPFYTFAALACSAAGYSDDMNKAQMAPLSLVETLADSPVKYPLGGACDYRYLGLPVISAPR